jgi:hypothetical protein
MEDDSRHWLIGIAVAVLVAALAWFFWSQRSSPAPDEPVASTNPAIENAEPDGPRFPLPPADDTATSSNRTLIPLPPLDDSDQYFAMQLTDLFGSQLEKMLADEALIEKFVATVDNLPRHKIAERIRPIKSAPGAFIVDSDDAGETYELSPENYERYEYFVNLFTNADTATLLDTYRRFYPLLQEAYVNLGYPDGYFNDRLVEVIDDLLDTPLVDGPIELKRPHVMYEYADPKLEALSSGQKLLLRTGPDQSQAIRNKLTEMRALLVQTDAAPNQN